MKKRQVLQIVRDQRKKHDKEYDESTTLESQNIARGKCLAINDLLRILERY
jgi:hypothetical protein